MAKKQDVSLQTRLAATLMYAGGPFFCYPGKPQLNSLWGDSYEVAYKHFRRDHFGKTNLGCHTVCLFFQVFGNFALLFELDQALPSLQFIPGIRLLSALSLLSWLIALIPSPAHPQCTVVSAAVLVGGYIIAPFIQPEAFEWTIILSFISVMATFQGKTGLGLEGFQWGKKGSTVFTIALYTIWLTIWHFYASVATNILVDYAFVVIPLYLVGLIALAMSLRDPLIPIVFFGAFIGRALYISTGVKAIYYLSCAFTASLSQGISHSMSGERATLINLQDVDSTVAKIKFEWAHVVFFPNLLLQSFLTTFTPKKK